MGAKCIDCRTELFDKPEFDISDPVIQGSLNRIDGNEYFVFCPNPACRTKNIVRIFPGMLAGKLQVIRKG